MFSKTVTNSLLLAFSLSLLSCGSKESAPEPAPAPTMPLTYKVTLTGNSLFSSYDGFVMDRKIQTELETQGKAAGLGAGTMQNLSVANYVTPQVLDQMPQINAAFDPSKDVNVLVIWEGTNHIYYGATAKQAEESLLEVCRQARAVHPEWKIVMGSILPRSEEFTPANQERDRQTVNTSLRAAKARGNTFFHELADVAQDTRVGQAGNELNKAYYADRVHLNDAGQLLVAPIFAKSIVAAVRQVK
jgi:lysophospholipase L1-like esterase